MKRSASTTGSRDEITSELASAAEGWQHLGRLDLAESAAEGAQAIAAGAESVTVGHIVYRVEP